MGRNEEESWGWGGEPTGWEAGDRYCISSGAQNSFCVAGFSLSYGIEED